MRTFDDSEKPISGRLLPLKEFAAGISRSPREVYRMIDKGVLPEPVNQGKGSFFFEKDLDEYLEKLEQQRRRAWNDGCDVPLRFEGAPSSLHFRWGRLSTSPASASRS